MGHDRPHSLIFTRTSRSRCSRRCDASLDKIKFLSCIIVPSDPHFIQYIFSMRLEARRLAARRRADPQRAPQRLYGLRLAGLAHLMPAQHRSEPVPHSHDDSPNSFDGRVPSAMRRATQRASVQLCALARDRRTCSAALVVTPHHTTPCASRSVPYPHSTPPHSTAPGFVGRGGVGPGHYRSET